MSKQAFEEAYEFYTKALVNDDKIDHRNTSKILVSRAQCSLKLKNYANALKDTNDAIKLDETNIKAYIRKGVSLYNQDLKEEALQVFLRGLEFDFANEQLKIWQNKCEKELAEQNPVTMIASIEKEKLTTNVTPVPPLPPAKIKHSFYQTDSIVTIQIPIKDLKKDQVHVYSTDTTINIHTKIPSSGQDYSLEVDLAYPVDSSRTNFNVTGSNIEIKLYKRQAIQWTSLDAQSTAAKAQSPDRLLYTQLTRLCTNIIKKPIITDEQQEDILLLIDEALLPSLSLLDVNSCLETYRKTSQLIFIKQDVTGKSRAILRRITKDNIIDHIQRFDNFICVINDALKYLSSLTYDIVCYTILHALISSISIPSYIDGKMSRENATPTQ
ncbi:unnamed protein product [Rotaria sordida]|uniref:CS domain-containing protein n=1 Tax=Rotaria sordida TaxID=392033 RepID=A0A815F3N5_9BILA|nr:unnamed protein product [Rotaria sordida]